MYSTAGAQRQATGLFERTMRAVALALGAMYLICFVGGWFALAPAGHEGVLTIEPIEDLPGAIALTGIAPGSPLERAGLRVGDAILSLNGAGGDPEAFHSVLHQRRAGETMQVGVRRLQRGAGEPTYGPREEVEVTLVSQLAIPSVVIENLVAGIVGLLILTVAVVVTLARPADLAARLLLVFGGCFAFVVVTGTLHWALPSIQLGNAADVVGFFMMVVGSSALLHLFLAFPVPYPILTWLRSVGPPGLRHVVNGTLLLYAIPLVVPVALATGVTHEYSLIFVDFLLVLVVALAAAIRSFLRSPTPLAHAQLKWVMWSLAIFVAAFVLGGIVPGTTGGRVPVLPQTAFVAAFGLLPIAIGFAILRYRLWDVDIIIHRTLVYGVLTAALAVVYFGAIVLLQQVLQPYTGGSDLAIAGSTLAVAALYRPARRRIQAFFDRIYSRRRHDAVRALAAFSARLRQEIDLRSLGQELQGVARYTMQPAHVSLWLRTPGAGALAARPRSPAPPGDRGGSARLAAQPAGPSATRVMGAQLAIVHGLWALLAVPIAALFVAGIPARVEDLRRLSEEAVAMLRSLPPGPGHATLAVLLAPDTYAAQLLTLEIALAAGLACTALLAVWRRPNDIMALFSSLAFVAFGLGTTAPLDALAAANPRWALPVTLAQSVGVGLALIFFYLFPDGRFVPSWTRWLAGAGVVWMAISPFIAATPFSLANLRLHAIMNRPPGVAGAAGPGGMVGDWASTIAILLLALALLTGVVAQLYRYARVSGAEERRQTKWVASSLTLVVLGYGAFALSPALVPSLREPGIPFLVYRFVGGPLFTAALLLIPLFIGLSIARYRLWEIELLVNRVLVYGAAAGALALVYAGSVTLFHGSLRELAGHASGPAVAIWTLVLAAVFHPLRQRMQSAFDRRFHRRKYDVDQTLTAYTAAVREETELGRLNGDLLSVVDHTMQPAQAWLWLRPPPAGDRGGT